MLQQTQHVEESTQSTPLSTLETSVAHNPQKPVPYDQAQKVESWLNVLRDKKKPRWKERRFAIERLASTHLTPEQREEVSELLVATAKSPSSLLKFATRRGLIGTIGIGGLISAALIGYWFDDIVTLPLHEVIFGILLAAFVLSLPLALVFLAIFGVEQCKMARVRMAAMKALASMKAVEGLSVLLSAARTPSHLREFDGLLMGLLNSLTPMHYGTLPTEAVPFLCEFISLEHRHLSKYDSDVRIIALMKALSNVGDGRAVAFISALQHTGKTPSIQAAAQTMLPILEERKRIENEYGMLLRHSSVPIKPKDELLRAAHANADTQHETLVRPVETPLDMS